MNKKLILITGASAGIGEAAAYALAAQGHELILVGRNPAKTEKVAQQIRTKAGNEAIHALAADFVDLEQVRGLAAQVKQKFPPLDVLVNNAGAVFMRRYRTRYGVEKTFLVNHLAHFLLTNLLLDHLRENARIVNVSSGSHRNGQLDLNDLNFDRFYSGLAAYGRSKLANVLFTYELARRLGDRKITVNALHPGRVGTDIFKADFSSLGPLIKWVVSLIALTPEQGADNTIFLAASAEMDGVTGKYFVKRDAVPSSPLSYDTELARQLWEVSERLTS
ncbi:MAG TPA: SDR family NAD(P)-dependent oxidoreductase [Anaerolineales bacterium]|nr:SDR family NAD(P)-dependent oxidoreductase [Anaerolineales bacterium]